MKKAALLLLTLVLNYALSAQQDSTTLTKAIQQVWEESSFPGFAVAIVDRNGVHYQQGFGYADKKQERPYTANTIQQIASVSKTFIAVAIMKAQEQGLVHLDSPINNYLPFPVVNPHFPDELITLRHLSTHTSGINDRVLFYELKSVYKDREPNIDLATFMQNYFSKEGKWYSKRNFTKYRPNKQYEYSNLGATLAAYVVECAVGKSFDAYTQEIIFNPLGMNKTGWFYGAIDETQAAKLYRKGGKKEKNLYTTVTYPDGNLMTSCSELSLYLVAMLNGQAGEASILTVESFQQMFEKQFPSRIEGMSEYEPNSGIVWTYRKNGVIGHTGGGTNTGITTFVFFDPEKQVGRIFITNIEMGKKRLPSFKKVWDLLKQYPKG